MCINLQTNLRTTPLKIDQNFIMLKRLISSRQSKSKDRPEPKHGAAQEMIDSVNESEPHEGTLHQTPATTNQPSLPNTRSASDEPVGAESQNQHLLSDEDRTPGTRDEPLMQDERGNFEPQRSDTPPPARKSRLSIFHLRKRSKTSQS